MVSFQNPNLGFDALRQKWQIRIGWRKRAVVQVVQKLFFLAFDAGLTAIILIVGLPVRWRRVPVGPVRMRLQSSVRLNLPVDSINEDWNWVRYPLGSRYFIMDGGWDEDRHALGEHPTVQDMFVHGKHYRDTNQYKHMMTNMNFGRYAESYWCKTEEEVDAYFLNLARAYEGIRANGYKTQMELGKNGEDEILVAIDRFGRFLQGPGGYHRLAIARLLGIPNVPVLICGVHYEWAKHCLRKHGGFVLGAIQKQLLLLNQNTERTH